MTTKKTLLIKLSMDITHANDAQIAALRNFWRASFEEGMPIAFEEIIEDAEATVERMLSLVRSEFRASDGVADLHAERRRREGITDGHEDAW